MGYLSLQKGPFPRLGVHLKNDKVYAVKWESRTDQRSLVTLEGTAAEKTLLSRFLSDLKAYVNGRAVMFDWPFDWEQGTSFQREVWQALRQVPCGETRSYRWLAEAIGRPQAMRAVGNANSKNPFALVVPCHRIIHKDGSLGGYSSGRSIKKKLLALEGSGLIRG